MATEKRLIDANAFEFEPDENCIANGVLIWGGRTGGKTMTTLLAALKKMIDNAPTVDTVEVVHGRWEWITEDIYGCTNCGETSHVKEVMGQPAWDYCPNCGARMKDGDGNG